MMRLQQVLNKRDKSEFVNLPKNLYKTDPNWVCPLDIEIESIFNPETNSCFNDGEAVRWLLYNADNKCIGRIAAFIDHKKANKQKYLSGGCGFFECINNKEAAFMLFDAAKNWLIERGMQAMMGPINFGENFNYWGLLVNGFIPQGYALPYNFPYYQDFFESYGFKNYFEQYSYHKPLADGWPERMIKFAEFTETRPGYSFDHFTFNRLEEFVGYFVEIYNTTWKAFHDEYTPLQANDIRSLLVNSKAVLEEKFFWFAFDNGKPVGLLGVLPDVNQILKKLKNGRLSLINKLKFLYYRKKAVTRCRAFIAGVSPDYQNTGIITALFLQLIKTINKMPNLQEIELSWVGDYNPKMIGIYEKIGGKHKKTHVTYMKIFDESLPFERFTNEFEGKLY